MSVIKRFKQVAMAIGVLVILAGVAMVGAAVYLWWDSRQGSEDIEVDTVKDSEADEIEA